MGFLPFSRFIVNGNSMLPTLKPNQDVLVFAWAYLFSKPKIGDIVVVRYKGKRIIKRIQKCQNNQLYIVGDNQKNSTDSRSFGLINKAQLLGKAVWY